MKEKKEWVSPKSTKLDLNMESDLGGDYHGEGS